MQQSPRPARTRRKPRRAAGRSSATWWRCSAPTRRRPTPTCCSPASPSSGQTRTRGWSRPRWRRRCGTTGSRPGGVGAERGRRDPQPPRRAPWRRRRGDRRAIRSSTGPTESPWTPRLCCSCSSWPTSPPGAGRTVPARAATARAGTRRRPAARRGTAHGAADQADADINAKSQVFVDRPW